MPINILASLLPWVEGFLSVSRAGRLLLWDNDKVAALGENGLAWVTDRIALDGIYLHGLCGPEAEFRFEDLGRTRNAWTIIKINLLDGTQTASRSVLYDRKTDEYRELQ